MLRMESGLCEELEKHAAEIVDSAYKVHKAMGPGLLESVYEKCMKHELTKRAVDVRCQVDLPVFYDGIKLESGLRIDMVVGNYIVVDLKSVERLQPVHKAQLLTYMKLSNSKLGFLLNFNVSLMKQGITRMVL